MVTFIDKHLSEMNARNHDDVEVQMRLSHINCFIVFPVGGTSINQLVYIHSQVSRLWICDMGSTYVSVLLYWYPGYGGFIERDMLFILSYFS